MRYQKKWTPWAFAAPALLVFAFVVIIPILWTIVLSFQDWNGITAAKFVGIKNYQKLLSERTFNKAFWNNLKFVAISTTYQLSLGLILAVILSSITKGRNLFKVMYFVPCIISTVAIAQIFIKFLALQPMGVINIVFQAIGIKPQSWLGTPSTALSTLALVDGYKYCGIYMVILYSGLTSIPQEVVEAAYIDGCGWFKQHLYIKLPMIKGVFGVVLVMLISGTLKSFEMPYVLTNGGPGTASEMIATYMYKTAFQTMRYGYSSAMAVFLMLECLIAVRIVNLFTHKSNVE